MLSARFLLSENKIYQRCKIRKYLHNSRNCRYGCGENNHKHLGIQLFLLQKTIADTQILFEIVYKCAYAVYLEQHLINPVLVGNLANIRINVLQIEHICIGAELFHLPPHAPRTLFHLA